MLIPASAEDNKQMYRLMPPTLGNPQDSHGRHHYSVCQLRCTTKNNSKGNPELEETIVSQSAATETPKTTIAPLRYGSVNIYSTLRQ